MSYTDTIRAFRIATPSLHSDRVYYAVWGLVFIGAVGDIVTTFLGLQIGLQESNPIARGTIHSTGFLGLVALKVGAIGIGWACISIVPREYRLIVPAGLALPWLVAVGVNVYMLLLVGL